MQDQKDEEEPKMTEQERKVWERYMDATWHFILSERRRRDESWSRGEL